MVQCIWFGWFVGKCGGGMCVVYVMLLCVVVIYYEMVINDVLVV